jgi:prolyl oligopeptidase
VIVIAMAILGAIAVADEGPFKYPAARKSDQADTYHGTKVLDPYRWLEDPDSAETQEWVKQENAISFPYLRALPMRETLRRRLTELWNYPR